MAELQEEEQEEFIQPHKATVLQLVMAAVELQVKREVTSRLLLENVFQSRQTKEGNKSTAFQGLHECVWELWKRRKREWTWLPAMKTPANSSRVKVVRKTKKKKHNPSGIKAAAKLSCLFVCDRCCSTTHPNPQAFAPQITVSCLSFTFFFFFFNFSIKTSRLEG